MVKGPHSKTAHVAIGFSQSGQGFYSNLDDLNTKLGLRLDDAHVLKVVHEIFDQKDAAGRIINKARVPEEKREDVADAVIKYATKIANEKGPTAAVAALDSGIIIDARMEGPQNLEAVNVGLQGNTGPLQKLGVPESYLQKLPSGRGVYSTDVFFGPKGASARINSLVTKYTNDLQAAKEQEQQAKSNRRRGWTIGAFVTAISLGLGFAGGYFVRDHQRYDTIEAAEKRGDAAGYDRGLAEGKTIGDTVGYTRGLAEGKNSCEPQLTLQQERLAWLTNYFSQAKRNPEELEDWLGDYTCHVKHEGRNVSVNGESRYGLASYLFNKITDGVDPETEGLGELKKRFVQIVGDTKFKGASKRKRKTPYHAVMKCRWK